MTSKWGGSKFGESNEYQISTQTIQSSSGLSVQRKDADIRKNLFKRRVFVASTTCCVYVILTIEDIVASTRSVTLIYERVFTEHFFQSLFCNRERDYRR